MMFYRDHAEKAIEILGNILQPDHLLLSSSKRVKGIVTNITFNILLIGVYYYIYIIHVYPCHTVLTGIY